MPKLCGGSGCQVRRDRPRLIIKNGPTHRLATVLTSAVLRSAADLIGQNLVPKHALPVGVATLVLGGVYLSYLAARTARSCF
ncbi:MULTISPECIES: iron chelate uptake ABC transporter family permease subunit [unclassified Microbacterium]|uniref:iron chelate uptake ABC transporter family permease subunit n=1 Tax=unclassified Microbacterium TaxID=2609290 RepID=UPI001604E794|nr:MULTISPECIES: iron chelate uptake ABC transporter family permease subunit [unclassified Microbacterium]QNA93984.1 iron chelate uptake ABC transporter family permease subunit [Microbacterium sp. Se63.02b]QYM64311.1 iron chelate uptake ABC transporter family permease subunit [Microbacterium sp. Se5.02b]